MKKKEIKKEEIIDITTLPQINVVVNCILLNFKNHPLNQERRTKILESFHKSTARNLKLICREALIDFAKETELFKEVNGRKEMNAQELAQAATAIILDRSIPFMKEKKDFLQKIEDTKKAKEEAIFLLNNPPPVDPKKKPDPKAPKPVHPDDIKIPVLDETETELIVIFYNYPYNEEEYEMLVKQKNLVNAITLINDCDEVIPEPENLKGKPQQPKEVKLNPEQQLIQRLFSSISNPESDVAYSNLLKKKQMSNKKSMTNLTYFNKIDFNFKINEETKKDSIVSLHDDVVRNMDILNKTTIKYLAWCASNKFQNLNVIDNLHISHGKLRELIKSSSINYKDYEHFSYGSYLLIFANEILNSYSQNSQENQNLYEHSEAKEIERIFEEISTQNSDWHAESYHENHELNEVKQFEGSLENDFYLINDNDIIRKNNLKNKLGETDIAEKEIEFLDYRRFPGVERYLMPELAQKEEHYRKLKKCEIYPFLTIGIPLYEKYEIIKKYEQILKQKNPDQDFDFTQLRFQEIMDKNILCQSLNRALMFDSDFIAEYNDRNDNFFISIFYKCPKERILRVMKKYRYLSKPNFENWKNHFLPKLEKSQSNLMKQGTIGSGLNINPESILRQSQLPNPANNIVPSNQTQTIKLENKKTLNPGNFPRGSITSIVRPPDFNVQPNPKESTSPVEVISDLKKIKKEEEFKYEMLYETDDFSVGEIEEKTKYMFSTDNGVFIRKRLKNGIFFSQNCYTLKDHLVFGIRKNKENVDEFWLQFENDVGLIVTNKGKYDPKQGIYDTQNGTTTTIKYKNGLNVQVYPNGDICQFKSSREKRNENYRLITSKATVIRYFDNDEKQIMYANGNVCNVKKDISINTNNKGYRVAKSMSDRIEYELDPIPITIQFDPESKTKTMIRDDKVMMIKYPFGSTLCIHSDETKIYTFEDKLKYTIEHNEFASIEIVYLPEINNNIIQEGQETKGFEKIEERSFDGRISKVFLPDKSIIYTYKEKKCEDGEYIFNTVTIIFRIDGTIIKILQDGQVIILTSQEKHRIISHIDEEGVQVQQDEFMKVLFGKEEDRKLGIYTCDMNTKRIYTRDNQNNLFESFSDGNMKITYAPVENPDGAENLNVNFADEKSFYESGECLPPLTFVNQRLFVVENDNTGYELLNDDQIQRYRTLKSRDVRSKYFTQPHNEHFISHTWITKHTFGNEEISNSQIINDIRIPKKLEKIAQTPPTLIYPSKNIYFYRNIIESQEFNKDLREQVEKADEARKEWLRRTEKARNEFASITEPSKLPELEEAKKIQRMCLEFRQIPDYKEDYFQILEDFKVKFDHIEIKTKDSVLFDLEGYIKELEKKKIILPTDFRKLPLDYESLKVDNILATIYEKKKNKKKKKNFFAEQGKEIQFEENYWQTKEGKDLLQANPRPPYQKKTKKSKIQESNQDENKEELFQNDNVDSMNQFSPIVYLEDEKKDEKVQQIDFRTIRKIPIKPSYYKQEIALQAEAEERLKKKNEEYIHKKKMEFTITGSERKGDLYSDSDPKKLNYFKKSKTTFPEAEFNEDYISIEKMTDHRVKTSSLANRLYFNAPSINEIRKSGQHNFLLEALDKKKTYDEMMERLNLMITSELCDPNTKMLKVDPVELKFGLLKIGGKYEMSIEIRNDDNLMNRIQIRKNNENKFIFLEDFTAGKIAPGISAKITVVIEADQSLLGTFKEEIRIMTKTFNYKIPVTADIISEAQYLKIEDDMRKKGKRVKLTHAKIFKPRKKKENDDLVLPKISQVEDSHRYENSHHSSNYEDMN